MQPTQPSHTGRRWDGRGASVNWEWPIEWESANPNRVRPAVQCWETVDLVHAACVCHGRIVAWEGTTLTLLSFAEGAPSAESRVPLPLGARPASSVPHTGRLAIVSDALALAAERGFLLAPTRPDGEARLLATGEPLAQVGTPGWWCGWLSEPGGPVLLYAANGERWHAIELHRADAPAGSRPAPRAVMAGRDGQVYWPGIDGGVWSLTCETGVVDRVGAAGDGTVLPWADAAGPRWAWEEHGGLHLKLSTSAVAAAGSGPLRGVHVSRKTVAVVGDRVWVFDARTGERLHDAVRPLGRWLDAVLAPSADGQSRLVSLTREETSANIVALHPSLGTQDHLWHAPVEARYLLCAGEHLCVVHDHGIVRLGREVTPGADPPTG